MVSAKTLQMSMPLVAIASLLSCERVLMQRTRTCRQRVLHKIDHGKVFSSLVEVPSLICRSRSSTACRSRGPFLAQDSFQV